jgi:hypothetical protein
MMEAGVDFANKASYKPMLPVKTIANVKALALVKL